MKNNKYKFGSLGQNKDVTPVTGPSHDEGGIKINPNTEIEGGESEFEGFVFSNVLVYREKPNPDGKKKSKKESAKVKTFADVANEIQKKYGKDQSPEAQKTKSMELAKLAQEQEELKASMMPKQENPGMQGEPSMQGMEEGVGAPLPQDGMGMPNMGIPQEEGVRKMFLGGAIASGVGAAINIGRGLLEKPRVHDNVEFERATANTIDLGEQRRSAALTSERARSMQNANIRNNAGSAGQLLSNSMYNNARTSDDLNRVQAESFANEENMNAQILNQTDQFNTQIANKEIMANQQIDMQNAANKDAKRELMFQGIGGLLGAAGGFSTDMFKADQDLSFAMASNPDADPAMFEALSYRNKNFWQKLGFNK